MILKKQTERVHGISSAFLADKPVFSEIVQEFLDFIADDVMIIHNASFDMGFINAELKRLGHQALPDNRAIDTLAMARKKFPGAQASLDALCRRFDIDNSHRDLHGALIDADLLAEVYIELIGGRQPDLGLSAQPSEVAALRYLLLIMGLRYALGLSVRHVPMRHQVKN